MSARRNAVPLALDDCATRITRAYIEERGYFMDILNLVVVSLMIEAVVSALKPMWSRSGETISAAEIVSMAAGVALAVACRINLLDGLIEIETPVWTEYLFYAMSGIAIGRGPSFLYDLWETLKNAGKKG